MTEKTLLDDALNEEDLVRQFSEELTSSSSEKSEKKSKAKNKPTTKKRTRKEAGLSDGKKATKKRKLEDGEEEVKEKEPTPMSKLKDEIASIYKHLYKEKNLILVG